MQMNYNDVNWSNFLDSLTEHGKILPETEYCRKHDHLEIWTVGILRHLEQ